MRFLFAVLVPFAAAVPASAGLLGQTVDLIYDNDGDLFVDSVVVGAGPEISCPGMFNLCSAIGLPNQFLDVDDTSITYTYDGAAGELTFIDTPGFSGFEFAKLDAGGNVLGPIVLTTNIVGLDMSRVSSTSSTIRINMQNLPLDSAGSFFTVSFAPDTSVPEPSSWALLFTGLGAGLAARLARRQSRN
jgi:hypothetical protein